MLQLPLSLVPIRSLEPSRPFCYQYKQTFYILKFQEFEPNLITDFMTEHGHRSRVVSISFHSSQPAGPLVNNHRASISLMKAGSGLSGSVPSNNFQAALGLLPTDGVWPVDRCVSVRQTVGPAKFVPTTVFVVELHLQLPHPSDSIHHKTVPLPFPSPQQEPQLVHHHTDPDKQ